MDINRPQFRYISDITETIYTISITAKENKFRSNMKILREMLRNNKVDVCTVRREVLSNCLWFAVLDQDVSSVRELMKHNPDANLVRSDINMLWMSIIRSDMDIARLLIEGGADVNPRISEDEPNFLHFLATTNDDKDALELAALMIKKGADVNACADGCSVLQTALVHEAVPFVELLVENGVHINGVDVIIIAARSSKSSELLPMLVDSTSSLEVKLAWVFGALQCLIENESDNLTAMKALLNLGLPVLELDVEGWTILRMAVYFGKIDMVKLLLNHGADVNQKSGNGNFPLFWAATNKNSSLAELLIENGADVHKHNDNGRYAIHGACQSASSENIELLLRFGANINVIDKYDSTPFSLLDDKIFSESHKLIIKHLAALVSVNDGDMKRIRECPEMYAYYEECLCKLQEK